MAEITKLGREDQEPHVSPHLVGLPCCPNCGSFDVILERTAAVDGTGTRWSYYRCRQCVYRAGEDAGMATRFKVPAAESSA